MIKSEYSIQPVLIGSGETSIAAVLELAPNSRGMVLWTADQTAHQPTPQLRYLGQELRRAGLATLLLDPPRPGHACADQSRFDLALLGARLDRAIAWLAAEPATQDLALGLFGSGLDAAAALQLAAQQQDRIAAVVSSAGRPDLAGEDALERVRAPTLLLVGEQDHSGVSYNRRALHLLRCEKDLAMIRDAGDRIEQPEPFREVARLAARWFTGYLGAPLRPAPANAPR